MGGGLNFMSNEIKEKGGIKDFLIKEDGMGVVEVILIIVVLISLVIIFRDAIQSVTKNILKKVKGGADSINYK